MENNLTPEQLAKIQALTQMTQHDLSSEDMKALKDYAPTENSHYIDEKGREYQDAQNKAKYNQGMAKIMFNRLSRRAQANPENLNELYRDLKNRIE